MIVTLYSKPGCHLCEDARALLDELAVERGFGIQEINIEKDATLYARYRYEIPVLVIEGVEIAKGRVDERRLVAALER
jgi:glutaredoxin